MSRHAHLFVVSGPSGVGKGTLVGALRAQMPDLALTVSATTRDPRPHEQDGVAYYFLSDDAFERHIQAGDFLEWAHVHGHRYATLRSEVNRWLEAGRSVVLEIDVQGALQVKRLMPEAVLIFIEPPSREALRERLQKRGTEDAQTLELRLKNATLELASAKDYDVCIVNDHFDLALSQLKAVIAQYESMEAESLNNTLPSGH